MPKANEVAAELRKIAEHLELAGDKEIPRPSVYLSCFYEFSEAKEKFLRVVNSLPHPLAKHVDDSEVRVTYENHSILVTTYIERSKVCTMIEPAKPAVYRCEPLLNDEDLSTLTEESNA